MKTFAICLLTLISSLPQFLSGTGSRSIQAAKVYQVPGKVKPIENLRLKITVGKEVRTADFVDSKTTRDFIKLLPLTLTLDDIAHREKYSGISRELSKEGAVKTSYQEGDLSYWLGGGIAAFYHQDSHEVKAGLIVLAKLGKGIDVFNVPGSVKVTFDAVKQ